MDSPTTLPLEAPDHAGGMLAIWHDVAPGQGAALREWYGREHHFERLAIAGFVEVRRFERVSGTGAEVFGAYRVLAPCVLRSAGYRARVDAPSTWTREAMRHFRNMSRTVCAVAGCAGRAQGGHVAALAGRGGALADAQAVCERLVQLPGVLQVTALAADPETHEIHEAPAAPSAEQVLRGGTDTRIGWALLLDADSQEAAEQALATARAHTGCREPAQCAVYRLCFAARNPS
ncbi:MAG: hypothetical protein V4609_02685 [Pseudomonadota bacterium]